MGQGKCASFSGSRVCDGLVEVLGCFSRYYNITHCANAQADLRLCWSHIPHCCKSHALAQFGWKQVTYPRIAITHLCLIAPTLGGS